jgi:hypothetical protein
MDESTEQEEDDHDEDLLTMLKRALATELGGPISLPDLASDSALQSFVETIINRLRLPTNRVLQDVCAAVRRAVITAVEYVHGSREALSLETRRQLQACIQKEETALCKRVSELLDREASGMFTLNHYYQMTVKRARVAKQQEAEQAASPPRVPAMTQRPGAWSQRMDSPGRPSPSRAIGSCAGVFFSDSLTVEYV